MEKLLKIGGLRTFLVVWCGQLVSTVGSGLTWFALGVYVYQKTGQATQFGLAMLAATLPRILIGPIAGVLVDRWDRRRVMLISDTAAGLSTIGIWLLLSRGHLEVWHIFLANAVNSFTIAFQRPAYMTIPTVLVPKKHFGRASGLMQLAGSIGNVVSPLLAGFLVVAIRIEGVLLIDFATYLFAMLTLSLVRIPRPETSVDGADGKGSLLKEVAFGFTYLKARSGLMGMLILFACANFAAGFHIALFTPLVLSFSNADVLGGIFSIGGLGMLVGSLVMSAWGGAQRKIHSLMAGMAVFGLFISISGLRADPVLLSLSLFCISFILPIAGGSSQAIWQAKVAPDVQGRVFATRFMIATAIDPLAYILAGPLADYIFEPLMAPEGPLAHGIGSIIGVGPGRGIGLIFIINGCFIVAATAIGFLNPRIRRVEDELPDCIANSPPSPSDIPVLQAASAGD